MYFLSLWSQLLIFMSASLEKNKTVIDTRKGCSECGGSGLKKRELKQCWIPSPPPKTTTKQKTATKKCLLLGSLTSDHVLANFKCSWENIQKFDSELAGQDADKMHSHATLLTNSRVFCFRNVHHLSKLVWWLSLTRLCALMPPSLSLHFTSNTLQGTPYEGAS